ncbi:hypothetical protein Tco_0968202 [Tanacetum coccineum]
MRADKLYKFSDGMLNDVQTALHDIASGTRMEYLPKRKWSGLDNKQAWVIVQDIDKQLYERRLMWNLEKFVSGREYGNDLRNNNSMSMSVQKSQVHKTATRSQDDDKRLCLVDDLKEVQVHIQVKLIGTSSSLKSKITTSCSQDEVKKTSLRAQD